MWERRRSHSCHMLAYHSRMLWSLCRDQWTNAKRGERQRRITNKGITGLVTPPKFSRNNLLVLNLTPYPLQSVTKRRCKVNSQCWNLCITDVLLHSHLINCKKNGSFFFLSGPPPSSCCMPALSYEDAHTATELLIQGALALVLPLVNTESI